MPTQVLAYRELAKAADLDWPAQAENIVEIRLDALRRVFIWSTSPAGKHL